MSKGHTLRALVNARLAAAADEIFALFERTIAEYEEELGLYKEQNQRKQQLLDSVLSPNIVLPREGNVQLLSRNSDLALHQEMTPVVKDEPEEVSIKHQTPQELTPDMSSACVKREESSLLQQSEQTQREDSLQTHLHPEEDRGHTSDHDEDWGAPFSWSDVETEAGGDEMEPGEDKDTDLVYKDHCYQVKIRNTSPAEPNYSLYSEINAALNDEDLPGTAAGSRHKKYQCSVCKKTFRTKQEIRTHERIHTGEKPFSCPFCEKTFTQKAHLQSHVRIHTGDKPFSCPTCNRAFAHEGNLRVHIRLHTGERPYDCSICGREFTDSSSRKKHMLSHAKKAMKLNGLKTLTL